jgi:hypothetical protein
VTTLLLDLVDQIANTARATRHVRYIFERLTVDINFGGSRGDGAEVDILRLEKCRKWDDPHSRFNQFVLLSDKPRVICEDGGQSGSIGGADTGLFDNIQRFDGGEDDRESNGQWVVPDGFNGHRTSKAADEDKLDRLKQAQTETHSVIGRVPPSVIAGRAVLLDATWDLRVWIMFR